MSRVKDFVETLEDFELLAFYKYRYDTFLRDSQVKIMAEIERRGLSLKDVDIYSVNAEKSVKADNDSYCPRCFSSKFYHANEMDWLRISSYYSIEVTNDFKTCLVCLYSQDKQEYKKDKQSFWYRLTKTKRVK